MDRRKLITGLVSLIATPAIVRASSLGASRTAILTSAAKPKYLGQVATRCYVNSTAFTGVDGFIMSRTAHYARDNITAAKLVYGYWWAPEHANEATPSGTSTNTTTSSIEYPAGVFTQVKWSGATSVSIASGATVASDFASVVIPKGALFWTRRYQTPLGGTNTLPAMIASSPKMNLALGDAVASGGSDLTMSGTVVDDGVGAMCPPQAIVAQTSVPSIGALGSSRMVGYQDTTVDSTGDLGYARMFGPYFGYINVGIGGDEIQTLYNSHALRMGLVQAYCSHLWLDPGLNDFANNGTSAAQVITWLQALAALWSNPSRVIFNNEGPWTTSTDSWATTVNQTAKSWDASRLTLNATLAGLSGYNQLVDCNGFDSTAPTSGAWNNPVSDGFTFTPDGVHENSATLIRLVASGKFGPALLHYP